jgi:hypothetical protein
VIVKRILDVLAWLIVGSFFTVALTIMGMALWTSVEVRATLVVVVGICLIFWAFARITNGDKR